MPCGWPAVSVAAHQLGITITPGGATQALARAARRLQPTCTALVGGMQASPVVAPDEIGWRVGGQRAWLWAFAGDGMTVYRIAAGRSFAAAAVPGADYAGGRCCDGVAARVVAAVEERLAIVLATAETALDQQPW